MEHVEGVGQKSGPCTATFNDLLCFFHGVNGIRTYRSPCLGRWTIRSGTITEVTKTDSRLRARTSNDRTVSCQKTVIGGNLWKFKVSRVLISAVASLRFAERTEQADIILCNNETSRIHGQRLKWVCAPCNKRLGTREQYCGVDSQLVSADTRLRIYKVTKC
jgi:hypothetical protein